MAAAATAMWPCCDGDRESWTVSPLLLLLLLVWVGDAENDAFRARVESERLLVPFFMGGGRRGPVVVVAVVRTSCVERERSEAGERSRPALGTDTEVWCGVGRGVKVAVRGQGEGAREWWAVNVPVQRTAQRPVCRPRKAVTGCPPVAPSPVLLAHGQGGGEMRRRLVLAQRCRWGREGGVG
jgi:hypothetical protein